jgi:hypothetical protein
MISPEQQKEGPPASQVHRLALVVMLVIVVVFVLVSLYANVQRLRRDKIESVTITPAASATPSAP